MYILFLCISIYIRLSVKPKRILLRIDRPICKKKKSNNNNNNNKHNISTT